MFDRLKRSLVGTWPGHVAETLAEFAALHRLSFRNPEEASVRANHLVARRLIRDLCPPGGVFLDVGAHIGSVLSQVHRADPSRRIIAAEADPRKARDLRRRFSHLTLLDCALGEARGEALFFAHARHSGYNSLARPQEAGGTREIRVAVERLDDIYPADRLDLVKIDVEGAELGVLRGAAATFARFRPVIMFESVTLGVNALGYEPEQIWHWCQAQGFGIFPPDRVAHEAPALGLESFLDGHRYPFRCHDYFAVPTEARLAVRDRARQILGVRVGG